MNTFVIQMALAAMLAVFSPADAASRERVQAPVPEEPGSKHLLDSLLGHGSEGSQPALSRREAGRIAQATGAVLTQGHYRQVPLDDEISRVFFTNYLSSLDYSRMVFTQKDVDEFAERYANRLDDLTQLGDASPAYEMFARYLERLTERNAHAQKLLEQPLDFATDERFNPQRDKLPWPEDAAAADEVWRLRVKFDVLQGRLAKDKQEDVLKNLAKRYNRLLKTMSEYDEEEILSVYLTALSHAYDPHSDYMSPSEARQFEISNVKLSLSGIGALLEWEDGYTRVKSLVPGGPAERSKQLKPKDRIVAVSQGEEEPVDVVEMPLRKVVELIRGKKSSEVRLTIVPGDSEDGTRKVVRLIRDDIKLADQFAKASIVEMPGDNGQPVRLGVVNLPQFYENCARDVRRLIEDLKGEKIEGLVLDLRRNGGGILEEAIELTGLFIREGPVVQVRNHNGVRRVLEDDDSRIAWEGPLVVAVGHLSASASEIVAAALQDYGRALIVGDSATHGKGTVQTLVPLSQFFSRFMGSANAGKLKFTVSKFYRIAGGTTQKHGVTPDIVLPTALDYMELGESHLPNCLPADRTTALDYHRMEEVDPYVARLRDRSANRVAASQEYAFIREDIEELKERKADPSVSLNEEKRIAEKGEREAREAARKKERRALDDQNGLPVFELTLEMLDKGEAPKLVQSTHDAAKTGDVKPGDDGEGLVQPLADAGDDDDEAAEDDERRIEPPLRETLNILADYLNLLAADGQHWVLEHRAASRN